MSNMQNEEENNLNVSEEEEHTKLEENIINNKEKNYIIAEINIDENNINKKIRLINSL